MSHLEGEWKLELKDNKMKGMKILLDMSVLGLFKGKVQTKPAKRLHCKTFVSVTVS